MSDLASLQYPIGKYAPPKTFSSAERAAHIDVLAALPRQLAAALAGLTDAQYDTPYRPEGWTIRQLVHHVGDSHLNAYSRMRLAITTDWPAIYAYPQGLWANLADTKLSPLVSAQLLDAVHQRWVATLRAVEEQDWTGRGFVHPENGRQSLEIALGLYAWHSRHHLAHIVNCRHRLGW